jgi:hypothetical protein
MGYLDWRLGGGIKFGWTCMRCDAMRVDPPEFHTLHTHTPQPRPPSTNISLLNDPSYHPRQILLQKNSSSYESSLESFAMVTWNAENNVKLLMIIQNHFSGVPDYERLAREWGSEVSVASLQIQFCKMRREGIKGVGATQRGRIVKNQGKGVRGRPRKVKSEGSDVEDGVAIKEMEEMECTEGGS